VVGAEAPIRLFPLAIRNTPAIGTDIAELLVNAALLLFCRENRFLKGLPKSFLSGWDFQPTVAGTFAHLRSDVFIGIVP